ncbi:MAG TPA: HEAT repeat domain-containing protein [Vicinamibacterales bacterium]|jgi:HEAT repeat protein
MIDLLFDFESFTLWLVWAALGLAVSMTFAVIWGRIVFAWHEVERRRVERQYGPLVRRALDGDEPALRALVRSLPRYRLPIARLLIIPLVHDRDPARIAATRSIADAMSVVPIADRFLRSPWWWRRTVALHVLGLLQQKDRTAKIVAALDDRNSDVRGAALDALADMQDPATLPAIVVRFQDASLQRGRRAAALAAFGSQCEPFLLELSQLDPEHRGNYARALTICGTERSRPALRQWTDDPRVDVREAAFEALAHVGLDEAAAARAITALENRESSVRARAASALYGWTGNGDAASHLARHLDDAWAVAVPAARSLLSMREAGRLELQACARRSDLAGALARQMLWEARVQC